MKKIFALFSAAMIFQFSFSQDVSCKTGDFNKDGIQDTLCVSKKQDSWNEIILINGSSKKTFTFYPRGYYTQSMGEFLTIVPIPDELLLDKNKGLLDTIEAIIFMEENKRILTPSFNWLIHAYNTAKENFASNYFNLKISFPDK
jgi:hypothetical protein